MFQTVDMIPYAKDAGNHEQTKGLSREISSYKRNPYIFRALSRKQHDPAAHGSQEGEI